LGLGLGLPFARVGSGEALGNYIRGSASNKRIQKEQEYHWFKKKEITSNDKRTRISLVQNKENIHSMAKEEEYYWFKIKENIHPMTKEQRNSIFKINDNQKYT
jgi:hypothetical protein